MVDKKLADALIGMHALTQQQYEDYLHKKGATTLSLENYLLDHKIITPITLARAYASIASLPFIDVITEKMIDLEKLGKIPLKFLRDNMVIPIIKDNQLLIVAVNPFNFQAMDELNMIFHGEGLYSVAPRSVISDAINKYYPLEGAQQVIEELEEQQPEREGTVLFEEIADEDILGMAAEAPVIKLVNNILSQAVKRDASDIHIEPFEKELRVRYRIDGVLYTVMTPPKRFQDSLISRIKIMAHLDIAEKRVPQDGRIQIKVGDKAVDIRVSILPVAFGGRVVMRLLDKTRTFARLGDMSFSERDFTLITHAIMRPNGIIYVTGPTGSGKTSTLYAILGELNQPDVNIVTVEDPIEYQMVGVGQVQVREKVGLTFAAALRSILRQDPDIVMIGETRDQETAQIAIQAALTGHLVLSTLHTNNAPATITRLIDMGIEPFLIASSIVIAIAQRLVRKLCDACKKEFTPTDDLIERLGLTSQQAHSIHFYKSQGCEQCMLSGYKGRIAIFEMMEITDAIVHLTMERANTTVIRKQAIKEGMTTLLHDGIRRIKDGITTIEEVLSVATLEHVAGDDA